MSIIIETEHRHVDSMSVSSYRKFKIKILERDFHIRLTPEQINEFGTRKTVGSIDIYFNTLLNQRFN